MTFPEIFYHFKNHYLIRRQSWSENVFAQYRHTTPLIRLVKFGIDSIEDSRESAIDTFKNMYILDNDVRFTVEDLLADDWVIYELI